MGTFVAVWVGAGSIGHSALVADTADNFVEDVVHVEAMPDLRKRQKVDCLECTEMGTADILRPSEVVHILEAMIDIAQGAAQTW